MKYKADGMAKPNCFSHLFDKHRHTKRFVVPLQQACLASLNTKTSAHTWLVARILILATLFVRHQLWLDSDSLFADNLNNCYCHQTNDFDDLHHQLQWPRLFQSPRLDQWPQDHQHSLQMLILLCFQTCRFIHWWAAAILWPKGHNVLHSEDFESARTFSRDLERCMVEKQSNLLGAVWGKGRRGDRQNTSPSGVIRWTHLNLI